MVVSMIAGLVIGLLGAVAVLAAATNSGNIQLNTKIMTEDTNIVKMLYMGKNLEKYSEYSDAELIEDYFKTGGPAFCGAVDITSLGETFQASIWRNSSASCNYGDVPDPVKSGLEISALNRSISAIINSAFTKYATRWGILLSVNDEGFSLIKTGSKQPGIPTVHSQMDFEWKSELGSSLRPMTDALESAISTVEKSYDIGDDCRLYNGTLNYGTPEKEYTFNLVFCS